MEVPQLQFSDEVFDVPFVVHVRGPDVQKSLELRQMQFCSCLPIGRWRWCTHKGVLF